MGAMFSSSVCKMNTATKPYTINYLYTISLSLFTVIITHQAGVYIVASPQRVRETGGGGVPSEA